MSWSGIMKKEREIHYPQPGFTTDKGNSTKVKRFLLGHLLRFLFSLFRKRERNKQTNKTNFKFFWFFTELLSNKIH